MRSVQASKSRPAAVRSLRSETATDGQRQGQPGHWTTRGSGSTCRCVGVCRVHVASQWLSRDSHQLHASHSSPSIYSMTIVHLVMVHCALQWLDTCAFDVYVQACCLLAAACAYAASLNAKQLSGR
jgi:hypothetical protein